MLTPGLIIHKQVDHGLRTVQPVEPSGVLRRGQGIAFPAAPGKAEGNVVGKPVIARQHPDSPPAGRLVNPVRIPRSQDGRRPFGKDRPVLHFRRRGRQGVVVDQLRGAKGLSFLAEELRNPPSVPVDLAAEFLVAI